MDSVRASAAPWSPSALPTSPSSRTVPYSTFMSPQLYAIPALHEDDSASRKYSTSPQIERRSMDYNRTSDTDESPDGLERYGSQTASVLLLRRLSASMSQEALNSMLLFASDLIDAQFVSQQHVATDRGFQAALARFSTHDGALEVRNRLHGKANASGDATMIVQVLQGATTLSDGAISKLDGGRRPSDAPLVRHISTSASSGGSSNGHAKPSRFSDTFQSMDQTSPTKPPRVPAQLDLLGSQILKGTSNPFSPPSPTILGVNGASNADRQRMSGKAIIGDDTTDDETRELLHDPLAFAQNDQRQQQLHHNSQQHQRSSRSDALASHLSNLRLDVANPEHSVATNGLSLISPSASTFVHRSQPLQSPSSDFSPTYGLSPMSPSTVYGGSPPFQRHHFPPANPADQNPPCNTLYVGNLPMDTLEEELKDLFSKQRGYKRLCFRTKHNGPMCFVEFEDVSFATKALNELYGSMLSNSLRSGIRLSFSKNPLGVRTGQANLHSPLTSPIGAGFGGLGSPPGFSTANGPPPGLSVPPGPLGLPVPPGLNSMSAIGAPAGLMDNGHGPIGSGPSSFFPQSGLSSPNGHNFMSQAVANSGSFTSIRSGYMPGQNGFPDSTTRRS